MDLSVADYLPLFLVEFVMILTRRWLLNTPLISGSTLETFKILELIIEQFQLMIEFMSSVDMENSMYFDGQYRLLKIIINTVLMILK